MQIFSTFLDAIAHAAKGSAFVVTHLTDDTAIKISARCNAQLAIWAERYLDDYVDSEVYAIDVFDTYRANTDATRYYVFVAIHDYTGAALSFFLAAKV